MRNICRVDHEAFHMHCWRVEVRRHSRTYRKSFSDGRYGGSEHDLRAAQLYRDALIQAHPPLPRISGVTRVDRVELSGRPQRRLCWEAHCPMGKGRAKRKRFSIRKYGEEGPFQRALEPEKPRSRRCCRKRSHEPASGNQPINLGRPALLSLTTQSLNSVSP